MSVTLHDVDDYDIEVRIPAGQTLYATRQGNWGLQEELYDEGVTTGVLAMETAMATFSKERKALLENHK